MFLCVFSRLKYNPTLPQTEFTMRHWFHNINRKYDDVTIVKPRSIPTVCGFSFGKARENRVSLWHNGTISGLSVILSKWSEISECIWPWLLPVYVTANKPCWNNLPTHVCYHEVRKGDVETYVVTCWGCYVTASCPKIFFDLFSPFAVFPRLYKAFGNPSSENSPLTLVILELNPSE